MKNKATQGNRLNALGFRNKPEKRLFKKFSALTRPHLSISKLSQKEVTGSAYEINYSSVLTSCPAVRRAMALLCLPFGLFLARGLAVVGRRLGRNACRRLILNRRRGACRRLLREHDLILVKFRDKFGGHINPGP